MWVREMRELDGMMRRGSRHWVGETNVRGEAVEALRAAVLVGSNQEDEGGSGEVQQ